MRYKSPMVETINKTSFLLIESIPDFLKKYQDKPQAITHNALASHLFAGNKKSDSERMTAKDMLIMYKTLLFAVIFLS